MIVPAQTTAKGKHATAGKPLAACETCGMAFKKLEHLQRHIRTHTQDRPYPCVYPGCGKAFARQDTLNRHARLHSRDEQDGGKPRARKRTKSVSEGSASGPRRQSTSPYPSTTTGSNLQQRRRSSTSSASNPSPVSGSFNGLQSPPAVTIPDLSPNSQSNNMSGQPRFSTFDILGLSPSFQPSSQHQLPALSELYPAEDCTRGGGPASTSPAATSPGVGAFGSFSPMANSLFLPQQQSGHHHGGADARSPGLHTHQLDFDGQHFAPSPSDDDNVSSTSDPSSLTPESLGSTVATSFHSSFQGSPDEFKHPQAPLHSVSGFEPVTHMTIPEHSSVSHAQPRDDKHKFSSSSGYIEDDDLLSMFSDSNDKFSPMMMNAPRQPQHDMGHSMPISMAQPSSSTASMSIPALDQHYGWPMHQAQSAPAANGLGMMGMSAPNLDYMRQWSPQQDSAKHNQHNHHMSHAHSDLFSFNDTSTYSFDLPPYLRDA